MGGGERGGDGGSADADGSDGNGGYDPCAQCGSHLPVGEWHPVTTRTTEDGERNYYTFCDEECQAAWGDEHGPK